jgi:two-component system, LytTR family, sensor kinase
MAIKTNLNIFLFALFGFRKTNSTINILLIVLIHAIGWFLLFLLPLLFYPVRINDKYFYGPELINKSLLIGIFYLNYYLLIPRLFEKKKYLSYFSLTILAFLIYLVQQIAVRANYFPLPGGGFRFIQLSAPPSAKADSLMQGFIFSNNNATGGITTNMDSIRFNTVFNRQFQSGDSPDRVMPAFPFHESFLFGIPKGMWLMTLNNAISSFSLVLLMGGFIRLTFSFLRNQNEKKALENANLNAEVNFLRSQINPHFLFNTLNSIYSQAHSKSENTEYSILKLSDLLRYVLYDSGGNKVELIKDIQYLSNYIDLQKIRLSSKVTINYTVKGQLKGYDIAPLLLITFIENAFKHGISYTNASAINIEIYVFEETLTMMISNPVVERNSFTPGGLGLKNVIRRLDLLYSGKYKLDIQQGDSLHIVNLKLDLRSD